MNSDLRVGLKNGLTMSLKALAVVLVPVSMTGCAWFTDFKDQPSLKPWESFNASISDTTITPPRGNPHYSVPIQGSTASALVVSYAPMPATLDSMSSLSNPVPVTEESLENGRMHYSINCAVCHGELGDGNGGLKKVNAAYAYSPSLLTDIAKGHSDGYIWGIIRNGRGALMPSYSRIEDADRWDVVNYVRALQGSTSIAPVIGALGVPGQNGATVPRASATAPTLPVPYTKPEVVLTPGSDGSNAATSGRVRLSYPDGRPMPGAVSPDGDNEGDHESREMFE